MSKRKNSPAKYAGVIQRLTEQLKTGNKMGTKTIETEVTTGSTIYKGVHIRQTEKKIVTRKCSIPLTNSDRVRMENEIEVVKRRVA